MKEFKYVITDPEGIHARPAGELVKATKEFQSAITLTKDGKTNLSLGAIGGGVLEGLLYFGRRAGLWSV